MTANLALSPWSKAAADPTEIAALDERAGLLDCVVSTIKRRDRRWMARAIANRGMHVEPYIGATLPGAIAGALDRFEAYQRARYTPEELVVIQAQSYWPIDHEWGE